jgi:hypothetical protein
MVKIVETGSYVAVFDNRKGDATRRVEVSVDARRGAPTPTAPRSEPKEPRS